MMQIIPGANFGGAGLDNIISPLPMLSGSLFACYLPGSDWNGVEASVLDYSGQRGQLILNDVVPSATGIGGAASGYAVTPFTSAQIAAGSGEFTWICVVRLPDGAAITPVLNAGTTEPYAALHASPGGTNISAFKVQAGAVQAQKVFDSKLLGEYAFIHGRWSADVILSGIVDPAAGWQGADGYGSLASNKGFYNNLPVRILPADGSANGNPEVALLGFYSAFLSDDGLGFVYEAARKAMRLMSINI